MRKKFLAALLALCMVVGLMVAPASAATFDDVDENEWYSGAVERWAGYGVLEGHGNGKFTPEANMNRAQFAAMVVRLLGLTNKSGKTFPDVEADGSLAWAKEAIDIAATNGIINGYPNGNFGGKNDVKFNEGATMMSRALGLVTLEESSGAGYATAAVNKLTELDMLDENVNADAAFNRAAVAGLADNMIAVYATEEKPYEETVTGEVKGVVLVVGNTEVKVDNAELKAPVMANDGASVEIKNSTVSAPIAVDSASVTLTNTKAEAEIVVSGDKASVSADKSSTVAAVTVEEGATAPEIKGQGISADKVTNNSTEDVKVNGTTVEGKPEENKPAEEKPSASTTPSNPGTNPPAGGNEPTGPNTGNVTTEEPDDPVEQEVPAAGTGTITPPKEGTACENNKHDWGEGDVKDATCTADGSVTYTCETCGATNTSKINNLGGHKYYRSSVTKQPTCKETGTAVKTCSNCGDTQNETLGKVAHTEVDVVKKDATCTEAGTEAGKKCSACGETISGLTEIKALGHDMKEVENSARAATCIAPGKEADKACSRCDHTEQGEEIKALGHDMKEVENSAKAATCTEDGKEADTKCSRCTESTTGATIPATGHGEPNNEGKCPTCDTALDDGTGGNEQGGGEQPDGE